MKFYKYILLLLIVLLLTNSVYSHETISFQQIIDTAYLPYHSISSWDLKTHPKNTYPIYKRMMVVSQTIPNVKEGGLLIANNASMNSDAETRFTPKSFPELKAGDDDPIRYTITTCKVLNNTLDSNEYVVGVCHNVDSIFAFRLNLMTDAITYKFLYNNKKNLKKLTPHAYVLNIEDYDYDGDKDILLYVGNQKHLRRLFQFGFNEFNLKWSLEVSSSFISQNFIVLKDSVDAKLIIATGSPGNSMSDNNYMDGASYLSIINNKGELKFNKIIGRYSKEGSQVIINEYDTTFFLKHYDNFIEIDKLNFENNHEIYYLSKLNKEGEVLKQIMLKSPIACIWMMRLGEDNKLSLFVRYRSNKLEIFDLELNLKHVIDNVMPSTYYGRTKISFETDSVYVFSDGMYDSDLTKILQFPFISSYFIPVEYDTLGNLVTFAIANGDIISIRYIKQKSFIELLSVFYHRNQMYLLMVLSGLLVGLLMVNYYRRKNKRILILISIQKNEIEETHIALKKAQSIIISQEKYRQAKDIAGGFAHEIRNSLFPARSALNKMIKIKKDKVSNEIWIKKTSKFADDSVERAINLTQLISQYTSLETKKEIEQVDIVLLLNNVIHDNIFIIENKKIDVTFDKPVDCFAFGNYNQFYIVFNNIILNAIDALESLDSPLISIQIKQSKTELFINIIDNGAGITSENIGKIYDVFYSTKPSSGSGLGLATVKKILELYDCKIAVKSELDKGSTFTIQLHRFGVSHGK